MRNHPTVPTAPTVTVREQKEKQEKKVDVDHVGSLAWQVMGFGMVKHSLSTRAVP